MERNRGLEHIPPYVDFLKFSSPRGIFTYLTDVTPISASISLFYSGGSDLSETSFPFVGFQHITWPLSSFFALESTKGQDEP